MSGYFLDTHTAIWFFDDNAALSSTADQIISDGTNRIYMSMASAWELAIKISIGKLNFADRTAGFLRLAETCEMNIIPIKPKHLTVLETLPLIHRDPFDRLIIATALAEQLTIITADENIARYDVLQIW